MHKYIIYTPTYDGKTGGIIVLYKLCSMLLEHGLDAKIWPAQKPCRHELASLKGVKRHLRWYLGSLPRVYAGSLDIHSLYELAIARHADLENAIVVYPEIFSGNPLHARRVVRWFLNKPGHFTGKADYGHGDLFFFYDAQFNDGKLNPNENNHLHVLEIKGDVYKQVNEGERTGTCFMVRKGTNKARDQHGEDATQVDGLSDPEMAKVFNRCKYFVSYDAYTLYSRYAALCGCIPVVVPEPGVPKEQWHPKRENRYGIAYGWDDIEWAVETRGRLLEHLENTEELNRESVARFVEVSEEYFESNPRNEC